MSFPKQKKKKGGPEQLPGAARSAGTVLLLPGARREGLGETSARGLALWLE